MCFVRWCNLLSFDSAITPWLSELSSIVSLGASWISERKVHIHSPSFVACTNMMYSDSVLNKAMIYCFFELHVTVPWLIWNEYLDIECRWGCPTQSTSQYPCAIDLVVHFPPKVSHNTCMVPRYTMTLFTASQCAHMGFWMNCARVDTANAQSGLEIMTGHRMLPIASAYGTPCIFASFVRVDRHCSFENFVPGSIGIETGFAEVSVNFSNIPSM